MDNKNIKNDLGSHDLELYSRKNLHITGVVEVISATTSLITTKTTGGPLAIHGSDLKIKNLNNTQQEVDIEGNINEIKYEVKKKKLLEKIFK